MAQPATTSGRRTRVLLALAAVSVLTAPPIAGSVAQARDGEHGRGRGGERREQSWDRGDRGGGRWDARDGPGQRREPPGQVRRYEDRREPPGQARRYEERRDDDRRYDDRRGPRRGDYAPPPGVYAPRPQGVRPGGYMPPGARIAPVPDYGRYRLRPPPAGYGWVRMGNAFVLMSRDGQIFDVIPD